MSRESLRESLLDHDWSAEWESLPEAPALVPRRKTAQVTLRLPASLLGRVKQVGGSPFAPLPRDGPFLDNERAAQPDGDPGLSERG